MGRRKVTLQKIENLANRQVTFSKRRNGVIKKAYELSVLCNIEVAFIAFSPSGRLTPFSAKSRIEDVLERYIDLPPHLRESAVPNKERLLEILQKIRNKSDNPSIQQHIEKHHQEHCQLKPELDSLEAELRKFEPNNIKDVATVEEIVGRLSELLEIFRLRKREVEGSREMAHELEHEISQLGMFTEPMPSSGLLPKSTTEIPNQDLGSNAVGEVPTLAVYPSTYTCGSNEPILPPWLQQEVPSDCSSGDAQSTDLVTPDLLARHTSLEPQIQQGGSFSFTNYIGEIESYEMESTMLHHRRPASGNGFVARDFSLEGSVDLKMGSNWPLEIGESSASSSRNVLNMQHESVPVLNNDYVDWLSQIHAINQQAFPYSNPCRGLNHGNQTVIGWKCFHGCHSNNPVSSLEPNSLGGSNAINSEILTGSNLLCGSGNNNQTSTRMNSLHGWNHIGQTFGGSNSLPRSHLNEQITAWGSNPLEGSYNMNNQAFVGSNPSYGSHNPLRGTGDRIDQTFMGHSSTLYGSYINNQKSPGPNSMARSNNITNQRFIGSSHWNGSNRNNKTSVGPSFLSGSSDNNSQMMGLEAFLHDINRRTYVDPTLFDWLNSNSQMLNGSGPWSTSRAYRSSIYDPAYEQMGLPVDPYLRLMKIGSFGRRSNTKSADQGGPMVKISTGPSINQGPNESGIAEARQSSDSSGKEQDAIQTLSSLLEQRQATEPVPVTSSENPDRKGKKVMGDWE